MLSINNQYDFFKNVKLTNDGYLQVSVVSGGTGGGTGGTFAYTAVDYTDLLTKTGMSDADLGYVFNSQGTQWLPGTIGGTFYPQGIYVYSGSSWTSDRNSIAIQLEQDTLGLATKANLSGATFSGSVDHTSTILSGGTDLYDIFGAGGGSGGTSVVDGVNTYVGTSGLDQTVNVSGGTFDNIIVTGNTSTEFSDLNGNTIETGVTASNIIGGTGNRINNDLDNVQIIGGMNVTGTTSGTTYFSNTDNEGTMFSGGTDLYDIFSASETLVQGGTNISTGGTASEPIINLDANIDLTSISADTIYSASTEISELFAPKTMTLPYEFVVAASDETTAITTGTSKVTFISPIAFTITGVTASLSTSGSTVSTIDVNKAGTTIFSTLLTIDANEFNSTTAATSAVITGVTWGQYDEIKINIDGAGTAATGLKLIFAGTKEITT